MNSRLPFAEGAINQVTQVKCKLVSHSDPCCDFDVDGFPGFDRSYFVVGEWAISELGGGLHTPTERNGERAQKDQGDSVGSDVDRRNVRIEVGWFSHDALLAGNEIAVRKRVGSDESHEGIPEQVGILAVVVAERQFVQVGL